MRGARCQKSDRLILFKMEGFNYLITIYVRAYIVQNMRHNFAQVRMKLFIALFVVWSLIRKFMNEGQDVTALILLYRPFE